MLQITKIQKFAATGSGIAVLLAGGLIFQAPIALAPTPVFDPAKVQKGMQIAPVTLNMQGKDRARTPIW